VEGASTRRIQIKVNTPSTYARVIPGTLYFLLLLLFFAEPTPLLAQYFFNPAGMFLVLFGLGGDFLRAI
jgi:hypothetical protein